MDNKLKGAFTLLEEEWIILAFGLGVSSIFGFPKTNIPPSRESVIKTISKLINKKYIEPDVGGFQVLSPYRDAIVRTGSGNTLLVRSRSDRLPDFICYTGKPLLLCEPMPQKRDAYRFEFSDSEELWERLLSAGYLPEDECVLGEDLDLSTAADMENESFSAVIQNKKLDAFSSVVFWLELLTEGNRGDEFLAVVEHPLFRYVFTDISGEKTRRLFDRAEMRTVFLRFIKKVNG